MKRIRRRAATLSLLLVFFMACSGILLFRYATRASYWASHEANPDAYADGQARYPGSIYTADGTLLYGPNGYTQDAEMRLATLHTVGDDMGNIATGVRVLERGAMVGYTPTGGLYNLSGEGGEVNLTLDTATTRAAYEALGNYNGTIGVYNYKTGEILCMVSKPTLDPFNPPQELPEGVYINRLWNGLYTPGSIFKVVTTAAALEQIPDIETRTYTCEGGTTIDGEWIACTGYHGQIQLERAFQVSCNAAFAHISVELGNDTLTEYAQQLGVTESFEIEGVATSAGRFSVEGASASTLAWAGIGQHTTLVCPMQYLILMGAIANEGRAVLPYFIQNVKTSLGIPTHLHIGKQHSGRLLQAETAQRLQQLMRGAVENEYGDGYFPQMSFCGKTGTAQLDGQNSHSLFVGFSQDPDTPLAVVVVMEHAGTGVQNAVPAASYVLQQAAKAPQP